MKFVAVACCSLRSDIASATTGATKTKASADGEAFFG